MTHGSTWFCTLFTCTQTFEHKTHICTHYTMSCFIFYKEGKEFSEVFFAFLLIMNFVRFKTDTFTFSIAFIDHISVAIQSLLSMDFNFEYLNV